MKVRKTLNIPIIIFIFFTAIIIFMIGIGFLITSMCSTVNNEFARTEQQALRLSEFLGHYIDKSETPTEEAMELLFAGTVFEDSPVYILDRNNDTIFSFHTVVKQFPKTTADEYEYYNGEDVFNGQQIADLFSDNKINVTFSSGGMEVTSNNDSLLSKDGQSVQSLSMEEDFSTYEVAMENGFLWYREPIITSSGEYRLMAAKEKTVSAEFIRDLMNSIMAYSIVGVVIFVLLVLQVISTARSNHKLVIAAYSDPVTKRANWNRFVLDGMRLLKASKRKKTSYAMISLDVDRFKLFNDLYGHSEGNKLLYEMSLIIKKFCKREELFARYQTDYFAILMTYRHVNDLEDRVSELNDLLLCAFQSRLLHFTFGIYPIHDIKMPMDRIYTFALMAHDNAKEKREKIIGHFDNRLREQQILERELENHMEEALVNHEYKVYLQPKYDSDGSKIRGAEALVRWISPQLGFISPGQFIPFFEKNGFIMKLDNYMLEEVCIIQNKWRSEGKELITISVNISRVHLMDCELISKIAEIVDRYHLPHNCIELELTESAFFDDKKVLIQTVDRLRELGFEVSMDDFGSGYSSLNSLKDLRLDVIKLDGEFFRHSKDEIRSATIIEDTVRLAKNLKMRIVAEGVEEKEQVDFLKNIGCDMIQGFYFAKPMPVAEYEKLVYSKEFK